MLGSPFQQQGKTVMVTAATSPPTPTQCAASNSAGPLQYVITNLGANAVFIGYGTTAAIATAAAVIPVAGTGQPGFWVLSTSQVSRTCPPNCFFTGITAAGTSDVHFEPGEGI